jgi:hypothetical protein
MYRLPFRSMRLFLRSTPLFPFVSSRQAESWTAKFGTYNKSQAGISTTGAPIFQDGALQDFVVDWDVAFYVAPASVGTSMAMDGYWAREQCKVLVEHAALLITVCSPLAHG